MFIMIQFATKFPSVRYYKIPLYKIIEVIQQYGSLNVYMMNISWKTRTRTYNLHYIIDCVSLDNNNNMRKGR
jgi:hypothetical protein